MKLFQRNRQQKEAGLVEQNAQFEQENDGAAAVRRGLRVRLAGMPKRRKHLAFVSCVLAVLVAGQVIFGGFLQSDVRASDYTEYTVRKQDIQVSVSGSGAIEPNAQYEVASVIGGDILSDTFEEGDTVEKGQVLYVLDSSDMENSLKKAGLSLEKARISYESSVDALANLTVTAPISGRIAELYVAKGDSVQNGAKIAKIIEEDTMKARIPFNINDTGSLQVGQSVSVTVENTFEMLSGTITQIYDTKRVLEGLITVTDVEVQVKNPGGLTEGVRITVDAGGISCHESAALEGGREKLVTAKTSGMVDTLPVTTGEIIRAGGLLATLESDTAQDNLKSNSLSLQESQLSYAGTREQLDDYQITAPISGSVISKTVKAGDTLEGAAKTVMAVIADMSVMTFEIQVDELDIADMEVGQTAVITVDAFEGRTFSGVVDHIGLLGTSTNGVTSYPVTIRFKDGTDLWPGMNATADIMTKEAKDVLSVPISAVNRGNTVLLQGSAGDGEADQRAAPEGAGYVTVRTGINNDSLIEVTEGLQEGDVILVPVMKDTGSATMPVMGPGGGMGGMPGGMGGSGGGMPSGGRVAGGG